MTSIQQQPQLDWDAISNEMIDLKIDSNQYQLVEELGRGSYGCLFLGQSLTDNSYVAIKILSKQGLDSHQLALQQLEIEIQSQLTHKNILKLHHTVQQNEFIFMIMELCDGGDLFEFVVSSARNDEIVKDTFSQVLDAIEYMHTNNIYHRDIKLENILLTTDQEQVVCKVADFGLATKNQFSLEFGCGSTTYLAPEHFGSEEEEEEQDEVEDKPYDAAASDIWSLGILLLALLFGRNPWQEATDIDLSFVEYKQVSSCLKYELFPCLSNELLDLLKQVLVVDPSKRLSITQFKQQFKQVEKLTCSYEKGDSSSEEEEEEEMEEEVITGPMDILPVPPKKSQKASYDSAIFSQNTVCQSWSDMVEEDLLMLQEKKKKAQLIGNKKESLFNEEDNEKEEEHDDIFIHSQEKESWWL
jgi:serine/threonine protein kinase